LVTGSQGYLGSVLAPLLCQHGHQVRGLDLGFFADQLFQEPTDVPAWRADIRDVPAAAFAETDAVIHLAGLSNDPLSRLDEDLTRKINLDATVRVAELARACGVRRFVFASSCIMYGQSSDGPCDETTHLQPLTQYARSKADAERALSALADPGFSVVFLRNGTVYGPSPRQRLDTVFNDFLVSAVLTREVLVRGDGQEWRPVVDIRDAAAAFTAATEAPDEVIRDRVFNTGADHLNTRIVDLAETAAALVPGASVCVLSSPDPDRRSYRADFAKFQRTFPEVRFRTPAEGGRDMVRAIHELLGRSGTIDRDRYIRLTSLRRQREEGRLDASLRWTKSAGRIRD
jgi:nucleoside-diphosphate-sugar epimerase